MPITILHGEDIAESRKAYNALKEKAKDALTLDGATISLTDLTQALGGEDLFGDAKQIFIEDLLSKRKSSKELEALTSLIASTSQTVTLWESKELTKKQLQPFSNATIKQFKIPSTIFALLDALKPNNGKQLITLFHQTLQDKDPEFVFFMLQRHLRTLLALHSQNVIASNAKQSPTNTRHPELRFDRSELVSGSSDSGQARMTISEVSRMAPWQSGKLNKQASLFFTEQLLRLHAQIFELEVGLKTGGLTLPLEDSLDFLFISL